MCKLFWKRKYENPSESKVNVYQRGAHTPTCSYNHLPQPSTNNFFFLIFCRILSPTWDMLEFPSQVGVLDQSSRTDRFVPSLNWCYENWNTRERYWEWAFQGPTLRGLVVAILKRQPTTAYQPGPCNRDTKSWWTCAAPALRECTAPAGPRVYSCRCSAPKSKYY